jgi:hypothetical protein
MQKRQDLEEFGTSPMYVLLVILMVVVLCSCIMKWYYFNEETYHHESGILYSDTLVVDSSKVFLETFIPFI